MYFQDQIFSMSNLTDTEADFLQELFTDVSGVGTSTAIELISKKDNFEGFGELSKHEILEICRSERSAESIYNKLKELDFKKKYPNPLC